MAFTSAANTWPGAIVSRARHPIRSVVETMGAGVIDRAHRAIAVRDRGKRAHLEGIVAAFRAGYVEACRCESIAQLPDALARLGLHHQGFAYEGAAMALTLQDGLTLSRGRGFAQLLRSADGYRYLVHVGAGWAFATLGPVEGRRLRRLDPLLRWLAVDAAGFHDGFLRAAPSASPTRRRSRLSRYGARAFDQGLGRSLWFTAEADVDAIGAAIEAERPERRPDLWSGVGLACTYAGGICEHETAALIARSGSARVDMAQGAAFASEAHLSASGCVPAHTERASGLICGMPAAQAAQIARDAAHGVADAAGCPAYETWRARIRTAMTWHWRFL